MKTLQSNQKKLKKGKTEMSLRLDLSHQNGNCIKKLSYALRNLLSLLLKERDAPNAPHHRRRML